MIYIYPESRKSSSNSSLDLTCNSPSFLDQTHSNSKSNSFTPISENLPETCKNQDQLKQSHQCQAIETSPKKSSFYALCISQTKKQSATKSSERVLRDVTNSSMVSLVTSSQPEQRQFTPLSGGLKNRRLVGGSCPKLPRLSLSGPTPASTGSLTMTSRSKSFDADIENRRPGSAPSTPVARTCTSRPFSSRSVFHRSSSASPIGGMSCFRIGDSTMSRFVQSGVCIDFNTPVSHPVTSESRAVRRCVSRTSSSNELNTTSSPSTPVSHLRFKSTVDTSDRRSKSLPSSFKNTTPAQPTAIRTKRRASECLENDNKKKIAQ